MDKCRQNLLSYQEDSWPIYSLDRIIFITLNNWGQVSFTGARGQLRACFGGRYVRLFLILKFHESIFVLVNKWIVTEINQSINLCRFSGLKSKEVLKLHDSASILISKDIIICLAMINFIKRETDISTRHPSEIFLTNCPAEAEALSSQLCYSID